MGQYTQHMQQISHEISPEDDNYTEELLEVVKSFRSFDEALDAFITTKGFQGDISDIDEKVAYIKKKFTDASVSPFPRYLRKWFTEHKRLEKRSIAFQFCFAFHLDVEESEEFFRTVCLQRGFDCHCMEEAVYFYAISNGLTYPQTMELLERVPDQEKIKLDFGKEVLFTESIVIELNRIKSGEELIRYLEENKEQFGYNNATAYKYITEIWKKIESLDGIAERERKQLFPQMASEEFAEVRYKRDKSAIEAAPNDDSMEDNRKKRSVWDIYLQILGLYDFDDDNSPLFVMNTDRTLKPILKDNHLLHPLAEESFPDRQGLEAILRGNHKSNELVRKTLILLVFYYYWMSLLLRKGDLHYRADNDDAQRCYAEMDRYLTDAGYPTLYAGNPYDWIFLFAAQDEYPMDTFRYFMRELYVEKQESHT